MASGDILTLDGTQIVWADTADFAGSPVARTVQIDLTGRAAGTAWQGVKVDLGATRAGRGAFTLIVEIDVASAAGKVVSLWWAASPHATAGTANPGGVTGADAAYSGTGGDSLADSIIQLDLVGTIPITTDADPVLQQKTWFYFPTLRWGSPVVFNETDQAFMNDADTMCIIWTPQIDQVQS